MLASSALNKSIEFLKYTDINTDAKTPELEEEYLKSHFDSASNIIAENGKKKIA